MVGIDIFSGAGGMSLGAHLAGIKVRLAIESSPQAANTYRMNHPGVTVLATDIANVTPRQLRISREEPTVLFGGPPCQGFSTSNQRTRTIDNPTNWLFSEYLRVVKTLRPDWVVFENVRGILETEKGYFYRSVLTGLQASGYATSEWLLNAADFGVPQKRWRVFVIGSRSGKILLPPRARTGRITVRDAISDLPILRNGADRDRLPYRVPAISAYAQMLRGGLEECGNHLVTRSSDTILSRYACIKGGGNWQQIPGFLMGSYADRRRCHTGIYRRLKLSEPSVVIGNFRKNMLIHPTQQRGLSVREAARLQSFPDSFEFTGSIGFQQQQVGNAVPPLLAKAVFQLIKRES